MSEITLSVHDNGMKDCKNFCCRDILEKLEGSGIKFNLEYASDHGSFLPSLSTPERFYPGICAVEAAVEHLTSSN